MALGRYIDLSALNKNSSSFTIVTLHLTRLDTYKSLLFVGWLVLVEHQVLLEQFLIQASIAHQVKMKANSAEKIKLHCLNLILICAVALDYAVKLIRWHTQQLWALLQSAHCRIQFQPQQTFRGHSNSHCAIIECVAGTCIVEGWTSLRLTTASHWTTPSQ